MDASLTDKKTQVALIILDGWGYNEHTGNKSMQVVRTPTIDRLWSTCPHLLLDTSGLAVGLPPGTMGNSEVGHLTIGAGTQIDTDLVRINKSITDDTYTTRDVFQELCAHVKKTGGTLHVAGLLSDAGVHTVDEHLFAFLRGAARVGISDIAVHVFTDGRDTPPDSGIMYVRRLQDVLLEIGVGHIASLSGRYYAMDRDKNWDRLAVYTDILFEGNGLSYEGDAETLLTERYAKGETDEFIVPTKISSPHHAFSPLKAGDGFFFFNYRADRARMLTSKLLERVSTNNIYVTTMTAYEDSFTNAHVIFPPVSPATTLGAEIAHTGLSQVHVAETEKYAHATYFLNGGREEAYTNEEDILIPSRKDVPTYDMAPEMGANAIADKAIEKILEGKDFIFINFANADMVGHTSVLPAIITALETVDAALGRVLDALAERGGIAVVTADHGNAEANFDDTTGQPHTSHTLNPVQCMCTKDGTITKERGTLADIAPTVLSLLNIPIPETMTGDVLIS
ncbi:MAG: 2,3-bisphosphoglycerate-independent phosphoglycerate mutase [Candidatus Yonathbacteria bacterium]|nr:2,3-bisphosphoglycerate-independent phosphoglycerate mutase [Candidatus Yonathbacteria bacterium]NTW47963.1 2,3-bisphosphoglycerate-independent phosphoglycerate mutase [Candidatus Yonathbacteria bacterium]